LGGEKKRFLSPGWMSWPVGKGVRLEIKRGGVSQGKIFEQERVRKDYNFGGEIKTERPVHTGKRDRGVTEEKREKGMDKELKRGGDKHIKRPLYSDRKRVKKPEKGEIQRTWEKKKLRGKKKVLVAREGK